jgi:hypothetical protein
MADGNGYVLFVWSPAGYDLREQEGDPPAVGDVFEDNGRVLLVTKIGASPLPDDSRLCAYSVGT